MTRRDVHPYALVEHNGEWYLVGHSPERNRETLFRIDRIRRLKLLDERFAVRQGFNVRAYRRSRMFHSGPVDQRVELWAAPELARWLRDERPLGRTRRAPDGSLRLSLRVGDPQWVFSWVMSHAGQLRVVGPELMRKRFVETCRKAAAVYR